MRSYRNSATPILACVRDTIRNRPGMMLGTPDIDKLWVFADATHLAEEMSDVPVKDRVFPIDWANFELWLLKKLQWPRAQKSFAIAKEVGLKDNVDAITLWFSWYDEFQEEKDYTEVTED